MSPYHNQSKRYFASIQSVYIHRSHIHYIDVGVFSGSW